MYGWRDPNQGLAGDVFLLCVGRRRSKELRGKVHNYSVFWCSCTLWLGDNDKEGRLSFATLLLLLMNSISQINGCGEPCEDEKSVWICKEYRSIAEFGGGFPDVLESSEEKLVLRNKILHKSVWDRPVFPCSINWK